MNCTLLTNTNRYKLIIGGTQEEFFYYSVVTSDDVNSFV